MLKRRKIGFLDPNRVDLELLNGGKRRVVFMAASENK